MPGLLLALSFPPELISWTGIALVLLGVTLGISVGAIPGLTGAMLIALTLPLTNAMDSSSAMILLVGMYVGSVSGGLITATLLRIPGTPASIITTLDGYPMAARGQAGRALGLGVGASLTGGLISWAFLVTLARPAADLSTSLGPFDFFSLVCVALVLIAFVSPGSLSLGVLSGLLGILATIPGTSPATGELRWTFGFDALNAGFQPVAVLIGLFALSQILTDAGRPATKPGDDNSRPANRPADGLWIPLRTWLKQVRNLVTSSVIGTWIGILPGVGANVGSVIAYGAARTMSKNPDAFGTGCDDGVVASESANNATVGGALIPLISLGIPGSVIDAILLGAFVIHGLQPGPLLFQNHPETVHTVTGAYLVANVAMFAVMMLTARWTVKLSRIPLPWLAPAVIVFCVIGSYALGNRIFDVWVMLGFGLLGLAFNRLKIPLAPFVIGFVLGPIAEKELSAGLMASAGSYWPLLTSPFSAICLVIAAILGAWPVARRWKARPRDAAEA